MNNSPYLVKILKSKIEDHLDTDKLEDLLLEGRFYDFEKQLFESLMELYDTVSSAFLAFISESEYFEQQQRKLAEIMNLKKLRKRLTEIQLRTGTKVKVNSFYAKKVPRNYEGNRHLGLIHLNCDKNFGLMYKSIMCLLSVVCPSNEVGEKICKYIGIKANDNRNRTLSLSLSSQCMTDRPTTQLEEGESLAGEHVVIEMDGGRIRSRAYKDESGPKRNQKFDTPWREPKLFLITTVDKQGKLNKQRLPIYDASFGDDETFDLLKKYLIKLNVNKAKSVQFIADGAPWIWNRARLMLEGIGVSSDKIIETLDYYHAAEHLHELLEYVDKEHKEPVSQKLKDALWQGKVLYTFKFYFPEHRFPNWDMRQLCANKSD